MFKEFKDFTNKINIMNLAVGVIIGGAFQKIINSLVSDIVMPLISTVIGKVDFSDMVLHIGNVSIKYGNFLTEIINFLIIAFSVFLFIKYLNSLDKQLDKVKFGELEKFAKKLHRLNKTALVLEIEELHFYQNFGSVSKTDFELQLLF